MFIQISIVYMFLLLIPEMINSFVSTDIVKSVKDETIYNLKNGEYCSFLCILALSTIIGTQLNCIYPSIGQKKYYFLIMLLNHVSVIPSQLIL